MDFGDLEQLQSSYRHEAADLLADLGDALLLLEQDPQNLELVNRIFRAMHTLKGSGASAGFRRLANFVHHIEEVFNRIRNHQLQTSAELIDATLKACDCCALLLDLGSSTSEEPLPLETEVLTAIRPFLPEPGKAATKPKGAAGKQTRSRYKIEFHPHREIFFSGTDPASLLLELADLGPTEVRCDAAELASCEDFDPEQCYLRWEISVETDQPESAVRSIFQFVEDDCAVKIDREELASSRTESKYQNFRSATDQCFLALGMALEQWLPDDEDGAFGAAHRAAQTLVFACRAHGHSAALAASQLLLDEIVATQLAGASDGHWPEKIQKLMDAAQLAAETRGVDAVEASPESLPESLPVAKAADAAIAVDGAAARSIRVDSAKLDALMRLAGELLVARGALPSFVERLRSQESPKSLAAEMRDAGAKISRLADDLQATVMSIRMLPARQVFQRFPRLVRDISRSLDKNIELHVSGEETELDKTVIESIGDPLTHIIRNAADHGIESNAERAAKGKSAAGRIDLCAYTRGSDVVIEVRDDGKGLDAEKLKRRAVEKGLYSEAAVAAMDEAAAFKIIMAAGFSTVDKVTDLSGRGVGMDVVRNSVEALNGVIHILSEAGKGTCFRIELPASMLVTKGILVAAAGQQFLLPMGAIRNMVRISSSSIRHVKGQPIAHIRGAVLPVLSLAKSLCCDEDHLTEEELSAAVIETASGAYSLIVDRFLGEVEVVIKPLGGVLAQVPEYIGAAIMGDGKTALVVNTERLFQLQSSGAPAAAFC
jgi:two-component system chemotaxis sensor kinase CheA